LYYNVRMIKITKNWYEILKTEFDKEYFKNLQVWLNEEYSKYTIYPNYENIFNALNLVKYEDVKVVIVGQDPYHEEGQAMGLSFSVPKTEKIPPSLVNIFKEIEDELAIVCEKNGDLTRWAKQGVLLLNSVLTVRQGLANSHKNMGWEKLTSHIIELLNERSSPVIFMLWGSNARAFENLIDTKKHYILKSAHPSPLSSYRGFFGNNHFIKCNAILKQLGKEQIDWK